MQNAERIMIGRTISGAAALFLGLLLAPVALAEDSASAFMNKVNANADQTLSLKEVDAYAMKRFDELNTNKDRTLSMKELAGRLSEAEFKEANTSHRRDRTLSRDEFKAYVDKLFVEANIHPEQGHAAADGTLSKNELETKAGKKLMKLLD